MGIDRQKSPYRRGIRFAQLPIPMVDEHCIAVAAGAVRLVVESRVLTDAIVADTFGATVDLPVSFDDGGATLHVCGTDDGLEHLRFDCFELEPHYHYIDHAAGANTVVRIDELAVGDPVEFSLAAVADHLPAMLDHCGKGDLAHRVAADPGAVRTALVEVRRLMAEAAAARAPSGS